MEWNTGNVVKDKYGFYRHFGCSLKNIGSATIWISRGNPTDAKEVQTDLFKVFVLSENRDGREGIVKPIADGFKTAKAAKEWANKNIDGAN